MSTSDHQPRRVIVFRKRMLPYSETFVAAQGNHLLRWEAVYAGATEEQSGIELLEGAPTCILNKEVPRWRAPLTSWAFKRFGAIPAAWLRKLRDYQPSLVHVHFGPDALFMGVPLAKALGVPLVVTFHGFDITINAPESRYQRERPRLFQQATQIIAVSDFIALKLIGHGCPEEKIVRHYIGIDLEKFTPFEGPVQRKDIVFVGRLTEKKGCRYLIEAMIRLAEQGERHHLHIIGDGALRESLQQLAQPIADRVTFHGRQSPDFVREKVGRAAVFCAPSVTSRSGDSEGLGMMNLEAMALGTPVVSTFHTAIPEAVIHEETGILVPEADSGALAIALNRCLNDEGLARKFGENGIAHVRRTFDLRKQCDSLEAIYDSADLRRPGSQVP
jgi:colanic acid/amylovoran biosynthesis glycosyltransferase